MIDCLKKSNNNVCGVLKISKIKMFNDNSMQAERKEIEVFYFKFLLLYVK